MIKLTDIRFDPYFKNIVLIGESPRIRNYLCFLYDIRCEDLREDTKYSELVCSGLENAIGFINSYGDPKILSKFEELLFKETL